MLLFFSPWLIIMAQKNPPRSTFVPSLIPKARNHQIDENFHLAITKRVKKVLVGPSLPGTDLVHVSLPGIIND